jgi:uncharacterized protein
MTINRRIFAKACALACSAGVLAACSSTSTPLRWYRLPSEPPAGEAITPRAANGAAWQLAAALPMPELLERDTLWVEEGAAGIRLLHGHRWAEPLRDTLPRLLRHDLALLVPGLWTGTAAPTAPNTPRAGRVEVELLALQGSLTKRQVALSARWVVTSDAASTPRAYRIDETVPWTESATESLVVAQRVAMWRLAQRIAASLQGG